MGPSFVFFDFFFSSSIDDEFFSSRSSLSPRDHHNFVSLKFLFPFCFVPLTKKQKSFFPSPLSLVLAPRVMADGKDANARLQERAKGRTKKESAKRRRRRRRKNVDGGSSGGCSMPFSLSRSFFPLCARRVALFILFLAFTISEHENSNAPALFVVRLSTMKRAINCFALVSVAA